MADTRISALTEETSPLDTDELIIQRGGASNFRVSKANLLVGAGGGSIEVGSELFAWNRTDVSQFESTAHVFSSNGGGSTPAPGDLALTVTPEATHGVVGVGNALRVDVTTMPAGGGVFGVLTSELSLPARYVVAVTWLDGTPSTPNPILMLGYTDDDGSGDFQGFYNERIRGSSSHNMRAVVNDEEAAASGSMHNGGTWDDPVRDNGGVYQTWTVFNAQGQTPSLQRVLCNERLPDFSDEPGFDGQLPHLLSGVGTNWDGVDMDRIGIGIRYGGGGTTTGFVSFSDFRIFAHPWD